MCELFTRDNITLAIAVLGAVGTVFSFLSSYMTKRKNLRININTITYKTDINQLVLITTFENRSQLPISVISVSLMVNKQEITPVRYPSGVGEYIRKNGNEIIDRKFEYNLKFPVDIQQLCAASGYILFDVSREELESSSTPLTLTIRSTRGLAQKTELPLSLIKWI